MRMLLLFSIADFVLLMCASQQWNVFECEHMEDWMVLAGENTDDPEPMEGQLFNPAPNFINCRYVDNMSTGNASFAGTRQHNICFLSR